MPPHSVRDHCLAPERLDAPIYGGRYLPLFKNLPALRVDANALGPVGGRIVGEVFVGIIDGDPESFRSVDPGWSPTLPAQRAGAFGLADILAPGGDG